MQRDQGDGRGGEESVEVMAEEVRMEEMVEEVRMEEMVEAVKERS